jgi:hypothetical protein
VGIAASSKGEGQMSDGLRLVGMGNGEYAEDVVTCVTGV